MCIQLTNFVTVFQTGQLLYFDWACNALEQAGIPFQRREETSGGLRLAMPAAPSVYPGTRWIIMVPEPSIAQARQILAGLPFEQSTVPDVWSFQPKPKVKVGWQIYAVVLVAVILLGVVTDIVLRLR